MFRVCRGVVGGGEAVEVHGEAFILYLGNIKIHIHYRYMDLSPLHLTKGNLPPPLILWCVNVSDLPLRHSLGNPSLVEYNSSRY